MDDSGARDCVAGTIFGSSGKRVPPIFFTRRREAAKKEKQKNSGREQETGAFLCFGSFGCRYWRRNFPVTHLTCFLFFAS
jgi:hypothetical protein